MFKQIFIYIHSVIFKTYLILILRKVVSWSLKYKGDILSVKGREQCRLGVPTFGEI